MLDFNPTEFLVVAVVALIVIGPKDLPKVMRMIGKWVGRARGIARQFRSGFDEMIREAELAELQKQWAAENERIMREHPPHALPAPDSHPTDADEHATPEPVMVAQPALRDEPEAVAEPPAPAPAPRRRKPPATGDTIEAPKPRARKAPATGDAIEAPKPRARKPRTQK